MALDYNCPRCNRLLGYEGLCWRCKADDERNAALNLTAEEIQERQLYLIENLEKLKKRDDLAEKYFWDCLSYHGVISEELQRAAVQERLFYPSEIYYKAPSDVRDKLIEYIMTTGDAREGGRLLECLAMQGDDKALEVLYELKKNPREWRKSLYVDSDIYAQIGGWTFDDEGNRQVINYSKCYNIERKSTKDNAISIGKLREDVCPHCSGKIVDILSIAGTDERLKFIGIDSKITATCCPNCVCYSTAFSRFDLDGKSKAVFPYKDIGKDMENYMLPEDYEELENNGMELSKQEVPLFYGANDWEAVTIGGFAHWIQDCEIIRCPDCGKPMRYLAQLSWETVMNDVCEGTLYIEICPECKVVSMHHQQT